MNSLLENKIRENAEEIFGGEPLTGHRDRFAGKLVAARKNRRIRFQKIVGYISIAAVFIGCILMLNRSFKTENLQDSEPLSEVQSYYSMLLQEKIDVIGQLLEHINENDRTGLMNDIANLQKEADTEIQVSDEKNIEFIVLTYSSKIEALQYIQTLLADNL